MSLYLRVKRHKTTYFIHLHHLEQSLVEQLTTQLTHIERWTPEQLQVVYGGQPVGKDASVESLGLENNAILYVVLRTKDDTFEEVQVPEPAYVATDDDKTVNLPESLVQFLDGMKPQAGL
eukprot:NODE_7192_length_458_cov_7.296073_g7026_i0.p1 GENE.NODE_7192_length_458_cov_7.296073_g7026_i0~~NODE_7192_length_458_cov_7.296073_g7026_i0.p1  ORF type:complete len:129 (+),score=53.62 NODE_7192_length_458_cov_7.296073_g7026_i0:30-389(+)